MLKTIFSESSAQNPLSGCPDSNPQEKGNVKLRSLSPLLRLENEAMKYTRDEDSDEEQYNVPPKCKRQAILSFSSIVTMAKLMQNQYGLTDEQKEIITKLASM